MTLLSTLRTIEQNNTNLDAALAYLRGDLAEAVAETRAGRLAHSLMVLSAAEQIGIDLSANEIDGPRVPDSEQERV